jgi:hypothetical protein
MKWRALSLLYDTYLTAYGIWDHISRWISSGSAEWVNITKKQPKQKYLITNTPKCVIKIFVMRFASKLSYPFLLLIRAKVVLYYLVFPLLACTSYMPVTYWDYMIGYMTVTWDMGGYIWRLYVLVLLYMSVTCIISHKFIYMTAIWTVTRGDSRADT